MFSGALSPLFRRRDLPAHRKFLVIRKLQRNLIRENIVFIMEFGCPHLQKWLWTASVLYSIYIYSTFAISNLVRFQPEGDRNWFLHGRCTYAPPAKSRIFLRLTLFKTFWVCTYKIDSNSDNILQFSGKSWNTIHSRVDIRCGVSHRSLDIVPSDASPCFLNGRKQRLSEAKLAKYPQISALRGKI